MTKCPGHLAELRIHQGTNLFWKRDLEGAVEKLTESLGLVPGPCKWLRFFAALKLVHWGILLDRPELLERPLPEAEKLAERYFEEERGFFFHLRGRADMKAGRLHLAEENLQSAVDRFRQTGERDRTLYALYDLHTLYLRSGRAEDAAGLRKDVRALVEGGEWTWKGKDRDLLLQLVGKLGELPWLQKQSRAEEVVH
jgi:tetratricopeptide (TPR) repeat protein